MKKAGLLELNRRVTEKHDHVPRWWSKHLLKTRHRKGGGKRRPAS